MHYSPAQSYSCINKLNLLQLSGKNLLYVSLEWYSRLINSEVHILSQPHNPTLKIT